MQNVASLPVSKFAAAEPTPASAPVPKPSHSDLSRSEASLSLEGAIPTWLKGRLIRTAPAVFQQGTWRAEHWFDGLGMLYSFELDAAGVRYSQRLMETEFAAQARAGRVRTSSFGSPNQRSFLRRVFEPIPKVTDNTNVNVLRLGSEWVALTESPHQLSVDERTLRTRGRVHYEDRLPSRMAMLAHPHFDFERERVVNLGVTLGRFAEIVAFSHGPSSRAREEIGRISLPELPYLHSFGLTPDAVVVVGHPFRTPPARLLWSNRGFIDHFTWEPEQGTRVMVLDREGGARKPRVFETDALFTFHTVNTFHDGPDVVLDLLAYPDAKIVDEFRIGSMLDGFTPTRPTLRRIRMRQNGSAAVEQLSSFGFEFPIVNYRQKNGQRQRFVWGSTYRGDGSDVVRIDCDTGTVAHWGLAEYAFGEPVFSGRPGATEEDDGVLLTVGSSDRRSALAVLDARTLQPHALIHADLPIPLGFHGSFGRE
jgi:carotenoid cleavage dioxygenase-like enzyme